MCFVVLKLIGRYENTLNLELQEWEGWEEINAYYLSWDECTCELLDLEDDIVPSIDWRKQEYLCQQWSLFKHQVNRGQHRVSMFLKGSILMRKYFDVSLVYLCILKVRQDLPPVHFTRRHLSLLCVVGCLSARLLGKQHGCCGCTVTVT